MRRLKVRGGQQSARSACDVAAACPWRLMLTPHVSTTLLPAAQAPEDEAEVQVGGLLSSGSHQRAVPAPQQQLQPERAPRGMTPSPDALVSGFLLVTECLLRTCCCDDQLLLREGGEWVVAAACMYSLWVLQQHQQQRLHQQRTATAAAPAATAWLLAADLSQQPRARTRTGLQQEQQACKICTQLGVQRCQVSNGGCFWGCPQMFVHSQCSGLRCSCVQQP